MEKPVTVYWIMVFCGITVLMLSRVAESAHVSDSLSSRTKEILDGDIAKQNGGEVEKDDTFKESRKRSVDFTRRDLEEYRNHKHHKKKHHGHHHESKHMLKILGLLLVAKGILFPILIKFSTAVSAASFVMSKIALVISGVLALKWLLQADKKDPKPRLEIVQVPTKSWEPSWKRYPPGPRDPEYYDSFWEDSVDSYAAPAYRKRGRRKGDENYEKEFA